MNYRKRFSKLRDHWMGYLGTTMILIGFLTYFFVVGQMEYQREGLYQVVYSVCFLMINLGGGFCFFRVLLELLRSDRVINKDFYLACLAFFSTVLAYWL